MYVTKMFTLLGAIFQCIHGNDWTPLWDATAQSLLVPHKQLGAPN